MSKVCQITGKGTTTGHLVSHSNRKVKRQIMPNLQFKKLINPATGKTVRVRLTTSALKTLSKWQKAGKVYDLLKLIKS